MIIVCLCVSVKNQIKRKLSLMNDLDNRIYMWFIILKSN